MIDHDGPLLVNKIPHQGPLAVPTGFSPSGYDALVSDAALDPCIQKYQIGFDYDLW